VAAEVLGFIVMFLRLGEMLIDAGEVFAITFLRMVPDQNWLTVRVEKDAELRSEIGLGAAFQRISGEMRRRNDM